jgi:hypothetical protein
MTTTKHETNKPPKDAAGSGSVHGLLEELIGIIASAMDRSDEIHNHEIKWLLELPLTDSEYKRLRQIVSSSNAERTCADD